MRGMYGASFVAKQQHCSISVHSQNLAVEEGGVHQGGQVLRLVLKLALLLFQGRRQRANLGIQLGRARHHVLPQQL